MQAWQQFYEMIGGAAATLLGLLFVAVSLNAEIILSPTHIHSRRLAEQAFQNYLAVLMLSLFVCVPDMGRRPLGYTILWVSGIWAGWAIYRLGSALVDRTTSPRSVLRRYFGTIAGFGMLVYAAYGMIAKMENGTIYVATGLMLLLISATVSSWQLLINVAQDKYNARKD